MTTTLAPRSDTDAALYPPTVPPRRTSMGLARFLFTFVRNPLRVLPEEVYHEPIVQYRSTVTWVTDPDLIKRVLLDGRESFAKTPLEKRVLGPLLGNGILTSDGSGLAMAAADGGAAVPSRRPLALRPDDGVGGRRRDRRLGRGISRHDAPH